ncbi:YoaK family protein [Parapedobacter sp. 10938]|uniref:YoaK family protein n=1 Tax=Parapedobacter flavus TaxID=3110225 RepID=UPI002DB8F8F9|nr:YoaK family protein [Parapedobacter sp. 10938]MEC3880338.1 YoaK family protein [Parapedobacter sp. 10938]
MLRHTGQKRTYKHNLRLAVLLCLVAGFVNAAGLLAFSILTTNITGHAAILAIDLGNGDLQGGLIALGWLCLFLGGTIFSGWYTSFMGKHKRYVYTVPLLIEFSVLFVVALPNQLSTVGIMQPEHVAGCLLFVMGMQNALVTVISKSVVRTTHLTGIMTDFGISLSNVLLTRFRLTNGLKQRLILQGNIILFFLVGGVLGAFFFHRYGYHAFLVPAGIILLTIFFDVFRMGYRRIRHHYLALGRRYRV